MSMSVGSFELILGVVMGLDAGMAKTSIRQAIKPMSRIQCLAHLRSFEPVFVRILILSKSHS